SASAVSTSICSSPLSYGEYESLNLLQGGKRSAGVRAIDLETCVGDGTEAVLDLHLLRDGLEEGGDESNDLSEDEPKDDSDVVGG
ncbi:hypothetical protein Tco_0054909, partial [Tanacetum coccineum]